MRARGLGSSRSCARRALLEQRACVMRDAPTATETRLFEALRGRRLGVSFRRQVPLLDRFIADLFASEVRLVVEVDGEVHGRRRDADARRDRALVRAGFHVLRVDVTLAANELERAVALVGAEIARLLAHA